ncbi:hypothetical protein [Streptomyces sp. NPDC059649]|uniref:hypothetical protein n=1 Tax=Streptomyces sp. NPDC059649 TaxID=3346895 RepID=UPI0036967AFB
MPIALGTTRTAGGAMQCRAAGHALLIHPKGKPDPQAVAFAAGLALDPQHTLAVVDLPFGALDDAADAIARLLAGRAGSLRLVFGRATPQESCRAAQRIADRLGQLVLAPDGEMLLTAGGGLFIPNDHGAGWLRFRPGREAERDSQRFPKPRWEFATFDRPWATSGHGVVEPVPSGVWVRSPRSAAFPAERQWLVDRLPSHADILTAVLGSPGGPPVPLADVARFVHTMPPSARPWVRFLHFGPVSLREGGEALGQELADVLGQQVVLYAGVPVQARIGLDAPEVALVRPDGTLGHRPFASELMYFPRTGGEPAPPALFGLRAPVSGVREICADVYEYAADVVLEVVQSGLWVRPPAEPAAGDAVRRIPASADFAAILYDRSTPRTAERMRAVAEDVLWRLDPANRESFKVLPADAPGTATQSADEAHLWSGDGSAATGAQPTAGRIRPAQAAPWSAAESASPQERSASAGPRGTGGAASPLLARFDPDDPATAPGRASVSAAPPRPAFPPASAQPPARTESDAPSVRLPQTESARPAGADAAATASGPPGTTAVSSAPGHVVPAPAPTEPPAPPAVASAPPPVPASRPVAAAGAPGSDAPVRPDEPPFPAVPAPETAPAPPASGPTPEPAPAAPGNTTPEPAPPVAGATPEPGSAAVTPAVPTPEPQPAAAPVIRLESDSPAAPARPGAAEKAPPGSDRIPGPGEPQPTAEGPGVPDAVCVQPVPTASACVVPPDRDTVREREWVRRTFSAQFNALAGTVSRVMSESPGLRGASRSGASDALTDLVAVRLYLSGDSAAVDAAIRTAAAGPHVPLARCVAAGLRRLPSYRGAALLRAKVSPAERSWYREGRLVTEWAFCTAYSAPHPGPEDGTDFLIWSMTARRTALIDPPVPHRVVFLPGTAFKVLRPSDGADGPVLLRELSPSEIAEDGRVDVQRVPLDEIALDGLERSADVLRESDGAPPADARRAGPGARRGRTFGSAPGLIGEPPRQRPGDSGPGEGAKL